MQTTTFDELAQKYVAAVRKMDRLVLRCLGLADDGDREAYYVHDSYTFLTGNKQEQDLILNNPLDAPFYGKRLNLFLESRLTDQSGAGNNELTFRPADWTPTNDWPNPLIKDVNANFTVRTPSGIYSSAPLSIAHAFSTRHGVPGFMPVSAYVGGLDFHRDYPLPRGTAMTVRVSPVFIRALGGVFPTPFPDPTSVPEYKVTAVLQGYKKIRAFR